MQARHEERGIDVTAVASMNAPIVDALDYELGDGNDLAAADGAGGGVTKNSGYNRAEREILKAIHPHFPTCKSNSNRVLTYCVSLNPLRS